MKSEDMSQSWETMTSVSAGIHDTSTRYDIKRSKTFLAYLTLTKSAFWHSANTLSLSFEIGYQRDYASQSYEVFTMHPHDDYDMKRSKTVKLFPCKIDKLFVALVGDISPTTRKAVVSEIKVPGKLNIFFQFSRSFTLA